MAGSKTWQKLLDEMSEIWITKHGSCAFCYLHPIGNVITLDDSFFLLVAINWLDWWCTMTPTVKWVNSQLICCAHNDTTFEISHNDTTFETYKKALYKGHFFLLFQYQTCMVAEFDALNCITPDLDFTSKSQLLYKQRMQMKDPRRFQISMV